MAKFEASLSVKSINNLIKQLKEYQSDIQAKTVEYVKELAKLGLNTAEAKIGESPLGHYVTIKSEISEEKAGCKAILLATGEVKKSENYPPFNTLLAIEFGAGIYYNKTVNPNANQFGLGVGTFPRQLHALEDGWYFWDEEAQEWRYTHGVKATMPMYNADMEIIQNYVKVAKDVFGKK